MSSQPLQIKQTIAKTLGVDIEKVVDGALLVKDLGADSLDMAELGMTLQEEYNVEISDDQLAQIQTVGDVVAVISATRKAA